MQQIGEGEGRGDSAERQSRLTSSSLSNSSNLPCNSGLSSAIVLLLQCLDAVASGRRALPGEAAGTRSERTEFTKPAGDLVDDSN